MKKEKLLASLKRVIKAADEIMSQMPTAEGPSPYAGTSLTHNGSSSMVVIKMADFSNGKVNSLVLETCPEGRCPPSEFKGRCCTFDATTGWNCKEGVMAGECASQNGVFQAGLKCGDQPPCGSGGLLDRTNLQTSGPSAMTEM